MNVRQYTLRWLHYSKNLVIVLHPDGERRWWWHRRDGWFSETGSHTRQSPVMGSFLGYQKYPGA